MALTSGRVVVITGAGGGIGRAEALLFASEGAKIVVNDLGGARDGSGTSASMADQVVAEIKAARGEAVANHDSVSTVEGAQSIIKAAVDAFGRIDVLVNNAGILRDKTLLKMDEAMWDAVQAVHLKGTFLCLQAAAKQMIAQGGGGRIVNTTSLSGLIGNFGQANYAAAKAGVYGLTRTASIELQKHRITVNALAPVAKTRMTEDLPMFQGVETMTPEHIAPGALFLGSDLCGDRTGHVLAIAGARVYLYKVVESDGKFKDENGVWTAQEIAENWDAIAKITRTLPEKGVASRDPGRRDRASTGSFRVQTFPVWPATCFPFLAAREHRCKLPGTQNASRPRPHPNEERGDLSLPPCRAAPRPPSRSFCGSPRPRWCTSSRTMAPTWRPRWAWEGWSSASSPRPCATASARGTTLSR
jgi:NAD(P)-dependent dehydrogenase (short-subunit alcohol dehydrogenase family)